MDKVNSKAQTTSKSPRPLSSSLSSSLTSTSSSPPPSSSSSSPSPSFISFDSPPLLGWYGVGIVALILSLLSLVLHLLVGTHHDRLGSWWSGALSVLAVLSVLIAVPLTHGLAGSRRHHKGNGGVRPPGPSGRVSQSKFDTRGGQPDTVWQFYQPFVGGARFVFLQALAWALYSLIIIAALYIGYWGVKAVAIEILATIGVGGVVSQLLVLASLHFYSAASSQRVEVGKSGEETGKEKAQERPTVAPLASANEGVVFGSAVMVGKSLPPATLSIERRFWSSVLSGSGTVGLSLTVLSLILAALLESQQLRVHDHPDDDLLQDVSSSSFPSSPSSASSHAAHVSLSSLAMSAILLGVPLTHVLTGRRAHRDYSLFQPFRGGTKFVALQAVGWTFWTLAVLSAIASVHLFNTQRYDEYSGIISSAGIGGVVSQGLVLLSLKYFDKQVTMKLGAASQCMRAARMLRSRSALLIQQEDEDEEEAGPAGGEEETEEERKKEENETARGRAKRKLERSSSTVSTAFSRSPSARSLQSPTVLAVVRAHRSSSLNRLARSSASSPSEQRGEAGVNETNEGEGNKEEDALAVAELIDTLTATGDLKNAKIKHSTAQIALAATQVVSQINATLTSAVTKEPVIVPPTSLFLPSSLSELSYKQLSEASSLYLARLRLFSWTEWLLDLRSFIVIALLYFVPIVGASVTVSPVFFLYLYGSTHWWVAPLIGVIIAFYSVTFIGRPQFTGKKSWPLIRYNHLVWSSIERYFSACLIHLSPLPPSSGPYVFGFHPHGIYPITTFWSTRGPSWKAAFPDLDVDVCGASIMFYSPLMREAILWSGGREVSAAAIRSALTANRSIMLIPGGQREMAYSSSDRSFVKLVTGHKGFVRIAIQHGSSLVPVFSFGETQCLENVSAPAMQKFTLRRIGFGFPLVPYGRWFSPLPNPEPVTVIVGNPIPVEKEYNPTQERIDEVHKKYYDAVREMFEAHKVRAGFKDCQLIYEH